MRHSHPDRAREMAHKRPVGATSEARRQERTPVRVRCFVHSSRTGRFPRHPWPQRIRYLHPWCECQPTTRPIPETARSTAITPSDPRTVSG